MTKTSEIKFMRRLKQSILLGASVLLGLVPPLSAATLTLNTNQTSFGPGNTLSISGSILPTNDGGVPSDIYVAVVLPNGNIQTLDPTLVWRNALIPIVNGYQLAQLNAPNFYSLAMPTGLPEGSYTFYLVATRAGANPIDSSIWLGSANAPVTYFTNPTPLLLNVVTSWANTSTSVSSYNLILSVSDSSGQQLAYTVKTERTSLRTDGVHTTTTDNIAVSYPKGLGSTYNVQVDNATQSRCNIVGGSGTVNDTNSGNATTHPTVSVTCN